MNTTVNYGFELEMVIRDKDGNVKSRDTTRLTPEQSNEVLTKLMADAHYQAAESAEQLNKILEELTRQH